MKKASRLRSQVFERPGARRFGNQMKVVASALTALAMTATGVVSAQAQDLPVATMQQTVDQAAPAAGVEAYKDAIFSPGDASKRGTISGSVKAIQEALIGFGSVQASGKALQGVTVYAQWYEGVKTQHASPIYYTKSDSNGNFTIDMKPYVDAAGVYRQFDADASVGATVPQRDHKWEKIRIWAELPEELLDQYRLVHQPAAGIFPGIGGETTPTTQGDGPWGRNKVSDVTIQYAQKSMLPQHLPKDQWVESTGSGDFGSYFGRAFWNLDVLQGALSHNVVSAYGNGDSPAAGLTVVGSYLSDKAVDAIHKHVAANFAGKSLRGSDWTIDDEQGLQKWISEQVAADPEGWVAETVKTTTAADGKFKLYWKGIYGNRWDRRGLVPEEKFHLSLIHI